MSDVKSEEPVKPAETKLVEPEATPAITDTVPTAPITVAEEPPKAEEVVEDKKEDKKEEKHEPKEITQGALQKSHGGLLSYVLACSPLLVPVAPLNPAKLGASHGLFSSWLANRRFLRV